LADNFGPSDGDSTKAVLSYGAKADYREVQSRSWQFRNVASCLRCYSRDCTLAVEVVRLRVTLLFCYCWSSH